MRTTDHLPSFCALLWMRSAGSHCVLWWLWAVKSEVAAFRLAMYFLDRKNNILPDMSLGHEHSERFA